MAASTVTTPRPESGVSGLVDHLFRRKAGQMVSTLTHILGPEHLDLAEEVVQEALLRALQTWPSNGVPGNPGGWLLQVARNRAIDRVRRQARLTEKLQILREQTAWPRVESPADVEGPVRDDELQMLLMCCHPDLSREARVALTLKTVGGFSVDEIARAFLSKKATVAQRLTRAKKILKQGGVHFELPEAAELAQRLASGLEVLYLMFNEGYGAYQGDDLVRSDLCQEAIRLTSLLAHHPETSQPQVHALLSLMLLQASRLPARLDVKGALVLLPDQDRTRWDRSMMAAGFNHLERSCAGEQLTQYHIQAALAAVHAAAPTYEATNWDYVLALYDRLVDGYPSPVVALNRAVALSMVEGPAAGITTVRDIEDHPALQNYYLLPATLGDLFARLGRPDAACAYFERALELPCTAPEKRFLEKRLCECGTEKNGAGRRGPRRANSHPNSPSV